MAKPKKTEVNPPAQAKPWTMPDWMEKYRPLFNNTGGNSIEELMNDRKTTIFANAPLAMLCVAVKSQVGLLLALHKAGHIK